MLVLHPFHVANGNPDFSEPKIICPIHLTPTVTPNEIHGQVQFNPSYQIEHFGIVVELEGTVSYKNGPRHIIYIFGPSKDSPLVTKSTVFQQICGPLEGLQKGTPSPKYRKLLYPRSYIFDFQLKLPTDRPLPPSMSSSDVDVTYSIIVYHREKESYAPYTECHKKQFTFYGYNPITPQITSQLQSLLDMKQRQPEDIIQPFSGCGLSGSLQLQRTEYLRNEEIPFRVHIINDKKCVAVSAISVVLLRTTIAAFKTEVQEVDAFRDKKPSNEDQLYVNAVFRKKRDFPSFRDDDVGGLQIVHSIKCEIETGEGTIGAMLEVVIGTTVTSATSPDDIDSIDNIGIIKIV